MERPPAPAEVIDPKSVTKKDSLVRAEGQARRADAARAFCRFGGTSASETPDPIPNSAVKRRRADGTASQDVGE